MKISPLSPTKPKPVALLIPGHRRLTIQTEWETVTLEGTQKITNALYKLSDFACYVGRGAEGMASTTPACDWVLSTWRGAPTSILHIPTGVKVMSLRSSLEDSSDPFRDLMVALNWLRGYGVRPASVSSMSFQLWRASLSRPVSIYADPEPARRAFFGGRQAIRKPAVYDNAEAWDIKAAYPTAMARAPFALSLREVATSTYIDPERAGLVEAKVRVPIDLWPPLPVRLGPEVIQYQWGDLEGVWTWREVATAEALGCDVEVLRVWAPGREADLFTTWFSMMKSGRELPGEASLIAKMVSNSLWGQFAMSGDGGGEVRWATPDRDSDFAVEVPARKVPQLWTVHVAAEVTSRVRTQTLIEAIAPLRDHPLHIDTDGVILDAGSPRPINQGDDYGQWRRKESMDVIDIKAPQVYRYRRAGERPWHYVAAGMPPDSAWRLWERGDLKINWSAFMAYPDVCIPSGDSDDAVLAGIYLADLERVRNVA